MDYRRRNGSDTWHWCRNCSQWPTDNYIEKPSKPYYGELCCECRDKEKAGACEQQPAA